MRIHDIPISDEIKEASFEEDKRRAKGTLFDPDWMDNSEYSYILHELMALHDDILSGWDPVGWMPAIMYWHGYLDAIRRNIIITQSMKSKLTDYLYDLQQMAESKIRKINKENQ